MPFVSVFESLTLMISFATLIIFILSFERKK
ncbi:putative holin-like toxin [Bacillus carboniphilus]